MVQLDGMVLPQPLIDKVPAHVANEYRIIPVDMRGNTLVIATADPDNIDVLDDLKFMLACRAGQAGAVPAKPRSTAPWSSTIKAAGRD